MPWSPSLLLTTSASLPSKGETKKSRRKTLYPVPSSFSLARFFPFPFLLQLHVVIQPIESAHEVIELALACRNAITTKQKNQITLEIRLP